MIRIALARELFAARAIFISGGLAAACYKKHLAGYYHGNSDWQVPAIRKKQIDNCKTTDFMV